MAAGLRGVRPISTDWTKLEQIADKVKCKDLHPSLTCFSTILSINLRSTSTVQFPGHSAILILSTPFNFPVIPCNWHFFHTTRA